MNPDHLPDLQQALLDWFAEHQRPLPWRRQYHPYEIWVSEIMLQQTQVKTMLPFYTRWMSELPTVHSVAAASEEMVLKLWEGLGYYSRVRNLQKAARVICDEHGGELPADFDHIRALPGIGPYTAGALASIAFNQPRPVVDGNIERVLCRIEGIGEPPIVGIAPAIANAVAKATGVRLRRLPMTPERVLLALREQCQVG